MYFEKNLSGLNRDQFKDILDCIEVFRCGLELSEETYISSAERVEFQRHNYMIRFDVPYKDEWISMIVYFFQNKVSEHGTCKVRIVNSLSDFDSRKASIILRHKMHRKWRKEKEDNIHSYEFFPVNARELQNIIDLFFIKKCLQNPVDVI
ncbi:hypothetical protein D3C87_81330 [compost metagenome]